ncbi:MAG TPA: N,N-dimethylformamidase beta subunit family domain-containing protein [Pseudonocardiaceae bacterium]|nr:N,N-dimethylformamidase beta subunit family domain-containing protein [Pseudonocardiaceae bacterium]
MPSPRSRLLVVAAAGVLVATAVAVLAARQAPSATVTGVPKAVSVSSGTTTESTKLGADGVQANWVIQENALPGTSDWRITGAPADGFIEGFADQTYASTGQPVRLFVSTSAASFQVEAYRIGYYGGTGARLVWASPSFDGHAQPKCPLTTGVNMVSCDNWSVSMTMQVTQDFPQGDYLIKLIGADDEQSYVPLTVWVPASNATYLVKNDVFTWQAWNPYGGYDYYQGVGRCPAGVYPACSRSRVVSYDRPYADGRGAGDFLSVEAPLVRFLEQHGLDVAYVTDATVQDHPSVLTGHSALLSLGHDECWTFAERTAITAANDAGLNLAFFGASAVLRHVRTQPSPLGVDRELVDYRDATEDPLNGKGNPREVTGNTWASPPANWPSTALVGEEYNGFLEPGVHAAMTVVDPSAWIFDGSGVHDGMALPDVIASDVDSLEPGLAHPATVQVLAHSALPVKQAQAASSAGTTFYSDMTYYTDPKTEAGTWDSGTNNWIPALADCHGASCKALATMTTNLLWLFGQGPAGRLRPSVANWRTYYPGH